MVGGEVEGEAPIGRQVRCTGKESCFPWDIEGEDRWSREVGGREGGGMEGGRKGGREGWW